MNLLQTLSDLPCADPSALLLPEKSENLTFISLGIKKTYAAQEQRRVRLTWVVTSAVQLPEMMPAISSERIKEAVAAGDIERARQLMDEARRDYPNDIALQRLERLIAPPHVVAVRRSEDGSNLEANRLWMRENANRHRGLWVAVHNGQLLGAAHSLSELRAQVSDTKDALVTQIA